MNDRDAILGGWDYGTLPSNVQVGADCYLERKHTFSSFLGNASAGLCVGDRVEIYTWCAFNVEPGGQIAIGDDSILVGAVFLCAGPITIGQRVLISYNVTIADCDFHPRDPAQRQLDAIACAPSGHRGQRPPLVSRPVVIEDDVEIGIGAFVLKGVRLGRGAVIDPGAVVTADVAPGARVRGNPMALVPARGDS